VDRLEWTPGLRQRQISGQQILLRRDWNFGVSGKPVTIFENSGTSPSSLASAIRKGGVSTPTLSFPGYQPLRLRKKIDL
jgi:hypothetical protein